ncbi:MAG: hypothetical protein HOP10_10515 [Chitinophagaceae bacterium]|nr:hypothetical protein [Chitinophagaceae bacterium]
MKNIILYISAIILLQGCGIINRRIYSSNQPNNPSLEKKNDYSISATYGTPSGFDLNAGYAVSNRVAIIGGIYTQRYRDTEHNYEFFAGSRDSSKLFYHHNGFHIGAGVYLPLEKNTPEWFINFFGGYTAGSFRMNEELYHIDPPPVSTRFNYYKSRITRWFAQGSLNWYEKIYNQSFIVRYNLVGYDGVSTDYSATELEDYRLPIQGGSKWAQFLDLSLDSKFFFTKDRRIGLQLYATTTARLGNEFNKSNFAHYSFRFGVGLFFKPSFKIKEKKD